MERVRLYSNTGITAIHKYYGKITEKYTPTYDSAESDPAATSAWMGFSHLIRQTFEITVPWAHAVNANHDLIVIESQRIPAQIDPMTESWNLPTDRFEVHFQETIVGLIYDIQYIAPASSKIKFTLDHFQTAFENGWNIGASTGYLSRATVKGRYDDGTFGTFASLTGEPYAVSNIERPYFGSVEQGTGSRKLLNEIFKMEQIGALAPEIDPNATTTRDAGVMQSYGLFASGKILKMYAIAMQAAGGLPLYGFPWTENYTNEVFWQNLNTLETYISAHGGVINMGKLALPETSITTMFINELIPYGILWFDHYNTVARFIRLMSRLILVHIEDPANPIYGPPSPFDVTPLTAIEALTGSAALIMSERILSEQGNTATIANTISEVPFVEMMTADDSDFAGVVLFPMKFAAIMRSQYEFAESEPTIPREVTEHVAVHTHTANNYNGVQPLSNTKMMTFPFSYYRIRTVYGGDYQVIPQAVYTREYDDAGNRHVHKNSAEFEVEFRLFCSLQPELRMRVIPWGVPNGGESDCDWMTVRRYPVLALSANNIAQIKNMNDLNLKNRINQMAFTTELSTFFGTTNQYLSTLQSAQNTVSNLIPNMAMAAGMSAISNANGVVGVAGAGASTVTGITSASRNMDINIARNELENLQNLELSGTSMVMGESMRRAGEYNAAPNAITGSNDMTTYYDIAPVAMTRCGCSDAESNTIDNIMDVYGQTVNVLTTLDNHTYSGGNLSLDYKDRNAGKAFMQWETIDIVNCPLRYKAPIANVLTSGVWLIP